jgi:hypothetical protein
LAGHTARTNLYKVPSPASRADFFEAGQVEFMDERRIPEAFAANPRKLFLSFDARQYVPSSLGGVGPSARVNYSRPSSDEILVETTGGEPGLVRILEAYDPGWTASVDDGHAPLVPANGFAMAVPVTSGSHTVRLRYRTPGRAMGLGLSLSSLGLLLLLIWRNPRKA